MTFSSGSSGDTTADRRYDIARQLRARGDFSAAADVMVQALELVPNWAEGHFVLAEIMLEAGQTDSARATMQAYLALDPTDSMGAHARLAAVDNGAQLQELTPAYVERLFDQYAPRFDKALVEGLQYSAPQHIRRALDTLFPKRRYNLALDLGCGTGLMGAAIRECVSKLDGIDLSAGMLTEAGRKNIYDSLSQGSLHDALNRYAGTLDLVLAADVFVYVGDLTSVMAAAQKALRPSGVFAFTVQAGSGVDYKIGADQRFSHSATYIKRIIESCGLELEMLNESSFRRERDIDVPGLLVVASKPA